jgi:catechol 2,3-dioxygenase-like lactoylglutathione lyase family enzyme
MKVRRAHHISFSVADLEQAKDFYGGLLGLSEIERPDFGFPGAWYSAGDVELHLIQAVPNHDIGQPPEKLTPLANHAAFEIESYAETLAVLRERGAEVIETGAESGQLFVQDPAGNVIEFIQPGGQLGKARERR